MRTSPQGKTLLTCAALAISLTVAGCSSPSAGGQGSNGNGTSSTRTLEHARGTANLPEKPQRVVVLEPVELDTAVALGVKPVGAAVFSATSQVPAYLGVEDVKPVGTVSEPDLEAIASLKPDLIMGTDSRHSKLYDQLNSIAPTVFLKSQSRPWQESVMLISRALGLESKGKELLNGFNERCEQIKNKYNVKGKTANLIRPRDETTLSLYGPVSFSGSALQCTGLTLPKQEWRHGGNQVNISPENILKAKADYVFVTTRDVKDPATIPSAITKNANQFPSVTPVDTSYWISGVGPKGGQLVLDDIEKLLKAKK